MHGQVSVKIIIIGLSMTSAKGNGHANTYRGLIRELDARGHSVLFLERDQSSATLTRDLRKPPYGELRFYQSLSELKRRYLRKVREAEVVIVDSSVAEGIEVGRWVTRVAKGVTAFYDADTPFTLAKLERGDAEYLTRALIPKYSLYLSFTGGPALQQLEQIYRSPMARALYDAVDPAQYYPESAAMTWDLGYAGAYGVECQPTLEALLLEPARRMARGNFVVAGPKYPKSIAWPKNVQYKNYLAPKDHRQFFSAQRFTLQVTRPRMMATGHTPNLRLFEAAACGTPIISDSWPGLDKLFKPRREILIARSTSEMLSYLNDMGESERREIGRRARERVLADHTSAHRAAQLERYVTEAMTGQLMA
jgi:spore maturation protein CgeB